ncbi:hypothetical protein F0U63_28440 [Cystobacter fuscus]|nr:hypothetical protein F0U63_28440 [Cystobacter fuscus]
MRGVMPRPSIPPETLLKECLRMNPGKMAVYPDALEPGTQVGRWRVVESLGVGGQGAVYRVEDMDHPGDFYALKLALHARDGRTELYALGVCLYRATTGHYPFSEWLPSDLLQYAIVHQRVPVPVDVNPRVPRALSEVIVRLLAKNPRERYASGAEVHAALVDAASRALGEWDIPIFDTEEVPPEQEGDKPQRRILRPEGPRPSWTFSPLPPLPRAAREERRRHWPRRLALATAVLLAMVPMTLARRDARVNRSWVTDVHVGPASEPSTEAPLPMQNQKLAPCTAKLEVEVSGACWLRLWDRPPNCPPQTVAYGAKCLWPVPKPHPGIPTSVDAGTPEAR